MFISTEKDQIFENGTEPLNCQDGLNGHSPSLESPYPPKFSNINVVPEHTKSEHDQLISNLKEEIVGLRAKQKCLDEKRKALLNKILDLKGSVRVFCRIRPSSLSWRKRKVEESIFVDQDKVLVKSTESKKEFEFDKVFCQSSTQEDVFVEVEPILRSAVDGHNVCVMAYGQTGTGKTFTMEGTKEQLGIVPRALKELFHQASLENSASITFSISMLEVYMGNLKDLLAPRPHRRVYEPITRCNLNIQADAKGVVEVEGLTEVPISDYSKAIWWYNKGRRARATSFTNVNDESSRSHCLTRITISHHGDALDGKARLSKLWMVDLGGSERLLKTGATGLTLDEGRAINLSLSALGDVIAALRRKRPHVPYRNSKLTQILRDCLGNDSKVLMLVHVSSSEDDRGETICSMSFAKRARGAESTHGLPEDIKKQRQKRIVELSYDMKEAEEEYQKVRNKLQKAEFLLNENNRLLSVTNQHVENEENFHGTSKDDFDLDHKEVLDIPADLGKLTKRRSLPHFMISTAASRHKQINMDQDIRLNTKDLRSGTRSSMQLSASQSLSFLDPRLKAIWKNKSIKHHDNAVKNVLTETVNCNDVQPKSAFMPHSRSVTSSHPNFRATLPRHRRRMSDLI